MNSRLARIMGLFIVSGFALAPFGVHAVSSLSERLAGRILLQVEGKGEGWYVDPLSKTRAYLGRPADAFRIMRELGLGITTANLEKIAVSDNLAAGDRKFAQRFRGRILLQVEEKGEAWYVNPVDLKRYYLGRPSDAFDVMRELGLGISNGDLGQIAIHEKYGESQGYDLDLWKQWREQKRYTHYQNDAFGFRTVYPDQWTIEESSGGKSDSYYNELFNDRRFYGYDSKTAVFLKTPTKNEELIIRRHGKIGSQTLAAYVEGIVTRLESDSEVWDVSSQEVSYYRLLGSNVFEVEYSGRDFTTQSKSLSVFFLRDDGYIYSITYRATTASYAAHLEEALNTFVSFGFFDPVLKADKLFVDNLKEAQFLIPSSVYRYNLGGTDDELFLFPAYDFSIGYATDFNWSMISLEEYVDDNYKEGVISKTATTLGERSATRISARKDDSFVVTVATVKEDKKYSSSSTAYRLYFTAPNAEIRDRFLPVFEQIVSSFQFTQ